MSIRVGLRSCVANEEFAENIRRRTTLVDFLPSFVAPDVGDVAPNWFNNSFFCLLFYFFIFLVNFHLLLARCYKHYIQHP